MVTNKVQVELNCCLDARGRSCSTQYAEGGFSEKNTMKHEKVFFGINETKKVRSAQIFVCWNLKHAVESIISMYNAQQVNKCKKIQGEKTRKRATHRVNLQTYKKLEIFYQTKE